MSGRERLLMALLAFVVVPLGLWFLAAQPLIDARARAGARLAEARALSAWVAAQDAAWQARGGAQGAAPVAVAPIGLSGIERALTEADLRRSVTTLENARGGGISIRLEGADFVAFARFLERIEREAGYDAERLRVTRGAAAGEVVVELDLVPEA